VQSSLSAPQGAGPQQITQSKAVMSHRGDDQLSIAELGLLFAAFSTLLCSMMLNVIVP